ncbi:g10055 [Coccomyxa elongata]
MIRWLVSLLEWILFPLAWYRGNNGLDDVVTELHGLCADLAAERERMAVVRRRITADLERWAAERERTAAHFEQRAAEREQELGDMVSRQFTSALAPKRAPSTRSASMLTEVEVRVMLDSLKCMIAPALDDVTTLDDLQESGQEFKWDPSTEASEAEGLITHMKQCLTVPPGVDLRDTIKIVRDARTGGVACWLDPDCVVPDKQLIRMQIFAGMPALYAFLDSALAALPASMLGFYSDGRRYEGRPTCYSRVLERPRRCELDDPGLETLEAKREL